MADAQGQPTIYLVEELPNGETAVGAMGIDYITKLQRHITFGELGHAAIVDSSGNIIAHPNKEWSHSIKTISKVKPVKHMINGESGVTEFYSPAVKADMITGYTVVPGVGWGVMVPQPIEELRDKAASARGAQIGIMVGGVIVTAFLGWLLFGLLIRPISAVIGTAGQIGKGDLEARVPQFPNLMLREYRELGMAFNNMAGRIQDERRQLAVAARDVEQSSQSKSEFLATIIRDSGESSGVEIDVADLGAMPPLRASEQRLLQIFVNLLSNAVKFLPEGGHASVRAAEEGADVVLISIADDGIGMTEHEIEQAMLSFTQVDSSLERRFEGTGLGLPLAKLLVEGHGGTLHMTSEPGKGTEVTVRLPAAKKLA